MSTRHSIKIRQLKLKRLAICLCEIKKIKRQNKINILRSFGYSIRNKISTKEIDARIKKIIPIIENEYTNFRNRQQDANRRKRLRQQRKK
jgi:cystathionine beta-lyase family protein involved in aluminum resistance